MVIRVMTGTKFQNAKLRKSVVYNGRGGFKSQTLSPIGWPQMGPQFTAVCAALIWPQTAAADQRRRTEIKDGKILNIIPFVIFYLKIQSVLNFRMGKTACGTNIMTYRRISPEQFCQRKIFCCLKGETDTFCFQTVISHKVHHRFCFNGNTGRVKVKKF